MTLLADLGSRALNNCDTRAKGLLHGQTCSEILAGHVGHVRPFRRTQIARASGTQPLAPACHSEAEILGIFKSVDRAGGPQFDSGSPASALHHYAPRRPLCFWAKILGIDDLHVPTRMLFILRSARCDHNRLALRRYVAQYRAFARPSGPEPEDRIRPAGCCATAGRRCRDGRKCRCCRVAPAGRSRIVAGCSAQCPRRD